MQAEFSMNQRTLMSIDPHFESEPFSEEAAKELLETRFHDLYSPTGRKAKIRDPFDEESSFECDSDDPEREAKEAEHFEKRGERLEQKLKNMSKEIE